MATDNQITLADDTIYPFVINETALRGRVARFSPALGTILFQHGYPDSVSRQLGELAVLVAMLGDSLKDQAMVTIQVKSEGAIDVLIADYMAGEKIRGYAGINKEKYQAILDDKADNALGFAELFGKGYLAITIDPGGDAERYQGIVELKGKSLSECVETYFAQSEQIDTVITVTVGQHYIPGGQMTWRGGGLMVQRLPEMGGTAGAALPAHHTDDEWEQVKIFVQSVRADELLDPSLSPQQLLLRLFHEEGVWVYEPRHITHGCRCSREKTENILRSIPKEELKELQEEGEISVICEFCNSKQVFTEKEIEQL